MSTLRNVHHENQEPIHHPGIRHRFAITGLVGSLWGYDGAATDVTKAYDQKYRSYLLADNLRQSSDDLTRLVRTYAETGDVSFKEQYNAVVEIRNGTRPRPQDYHRIYWDFVASGETKPRPDGVAVSLNDLMKQAGFTDEEFSLLDEAGKRSDALIKLETEAMDLVDNAATKGPESQRKATQMLNSPDYHRYKAEIMKPVDTFFVKLEARTQAAVDEANARASFYWSLTIAAMSALVLMLAIVGLVTFKRIIGGMYKLGASMGLVAGGQLDAQIDLAKNNDEIGDMGKALEVFRQGAIANRRLEKEAEENRRRAEAERIATQEKAEADAAERLRVATSGPAAGLKRLASGDLAFQLNEAFAQDFEALRRDFNQSVSQLGTTMSEISNSISGQSIAARGRSARRSTIFPSARNSRPPRLRKRPRRLMRSPSMSPIPPSGPKKPHVGEPRQSIGGPNSSHVVAHAEEAMRRIEERLAADLQHHRRHRRDRLPDQPSGAECRRRGGACRRCRQGLCRRRPGSARTCPALRQGRQGDQGADPTTPSAEVETGVKLVAKPARR